MLRHTLATLAYRAGKVLRDAPNGFGDFRQEAGSRSAGQILAHMGDLMDWSISIAQGQQAWNDSPPLAWDADVERFFDGLARFDACLAGDAPAADPLGLAPVPGPHRRCAHARRAARDDAADGRRRRSAARTISRPTSRRVASGSTRPRRRGSSDVSWKLIAGSWKRRAAIAVGCLVLAADLSGQSATFKSPPPRFADPDRRAKLEKAFPEIDRLFQDYAASAHVPGAAWGIVIDGELAHTGVTGYRDVPSKAPVTPDSVFRIASMTKSFTAIAILKLRDEGQAVARRSGGEVRPGDEGARLSDQRLAEDHDPAPPVARGRVPRGQPVGRPAARGHRRAALAR